MVVDADTFGIGKVYAARFNHLGNDYNAYYFEQDSVGEYFDEEGSFNFRDWNAEQGTIHRSIRFDSRNKDGSHSYTSIIVDAFKK